jgi:hypothetical protein
MTYLPRLNKIAFLSLPVVIILLAITINVLSDSWGQGPLYAPSATPNITWSEPQVNIGLSPSESISKEIFLISNIKLKKIQFDISPEIVQFINIQPESVKKIPANSQKRIDLFFSVSPGTNPGKREGVILIRNRKQEILSQIKVVIDIFHSFTDSTQGLTLQYPDFGQPTRITITPISPDKKLLNVELQQGTQGGFNTVFGLMIYDNPKGLSLQQWFQQNIDLDNVLTNNGTFEKRLLKNGLEALVREKTIPLQYEGGPVEEAYVISSTGRRVVSIVQSQDHILADLGYPQSAIRDLQIRVIERIQF